MSLSVVFSVGLVVFLIATWGAVMAGGLWLAASDERYK